MEKLMVHTTAGIGIAGRGRGNVNITNTEVSATDSMRSDPEFEVQFEVEDVKVPPSSAAMGEFPSEMLIVPITPSGSDEYLINSDAIKVYFTPPDEASGARALMRIVFVFPGGNVVPTASVLPQSH